MACGSWTNYCQAVQTKPISWSTLYCRFDRELIPNIQITDEGLNELNTKLDLHSAPPKTSKSTRLLLLSTKMFWWLELFRKKTMEDNPFRFKPILKETSKNFQVLIFWYIPYWCITCWWEALGYYAPLVLLNLLYTQQSSFHLHSEFRALLWCVARLCFSWTWGLSTENLAWSHAPSQDCQFPLEKTFSYISHYTDKN